jgi:two-component system phosphate regulon response regulator PhoB
MLTARQEEADMVAGLELGADDYITKPFSPRVLKARIKAVLRRKNGGETEESELLRRGELVIDSGRHEVKLAGESVSLTYTEFGLLRLLAGRPGWVFDRYQILDSIKGDDYDVTDRSVDVHIASLRKKLGAWGKHIETVRGVGYRFRE